MQFYAHVPRQHSEWMEPDTIKMQFERPEDYVEPKVTNHFSDFRF